MVIAAGLFREKFQQIGITRRKNERGNAVWNTCQYFSSPPGEEVKIWLRIPWKDSLHEVNIYLIIPSVMKIEKKKKENHFTLIEPEISFPIEFMFVSAIAIIDVISIVFSSVDVSTKFFSFH